MDFHEVIDLIILQIVEIEQEAATVVSHYTIVPHKRKVHVGRILNYETIDTEQATSANTRIAPTRAHAQD